MSDAQILEHMRLVFDITPYRLADIAGISSGHLYRVENGIKSLGLSSIRKILNTLPEKKPEAAAWFKGVIFDR